MALKFNLKLLNKNENLHIQSHLDKNLKVNFLKKKKTSFGLSVRCRKYNIQYVHCTWTTKIYIRNQYLSQR